MKCKYCEKVGEKKDFYSKHRCLACRRSSMLERYYRLKSPAHKIEPWPVVNKVEHYCSVCKDMRPISQFNKHSKRADGLQTACKPCKGVERRKAKRWLKDSYKDKYNQLARDRYARRYQSDPVYTTKVRIRGILGQALRRKQYSKGTKTENMLGTDWNTLYIHLRHSFEANYGLGWDSSYWPLVDVDHIIPLASASTPEEVAALNHYTNLQLLFKEDNRKKSDHILSNHQVLNR